MGLWSSWRRLLGRPQPERSARARSAAPSAPRSTSLRAALAAAREGGTSHSAPGAASADAASLPGEPAPASEAPLRLRLAIDDVGDWAVHIGGTVLLGQAGAGRAHVGLHAPVAPVHAWLRASSSFHGGEGWDLVPAPGEEVLLDGVPLDGPAPLHDGARISLGPELCLTVRRPDPASASLVLCAERDEVLGGAGGVLAWFPGPGGRIRLGPDQQALLGLPGAQDEVLLEASSAGLFLAGSGALPGRAAPAGEGGTEPTEAWIPLPLVEVHEVRLRLRGEAAATSFCFLPPTGSPAGPPTGPPAGTPTGPGSTGG